MSLWNRSYLLCQNRQCPSVQTLQKNPSSLQCFAPALAPLAALPPRAGAIFFALQKINS